MTIVTFDDVFEWSLIAGIWAGVFLVLAALTLI